MAKLELTGRILFLCADPERVERQLAGVNLTESTAGTLRDDVSTDEITPMSVLTRFDERLSRVPYLGLRTCGRNPIGPDTIHNGGFCVTVACNRYGKRSSREHCPLAEYRAGIRLVIARSFERIYRQVSISAINRNFPGRSGPGQAWLASPPTVVASALLGHLASFAELQEQYQ